MTITRLNLALLAFGLVLMAIALSVGPVAYRLPDVWRALFGRGADEILLIVREIRFPRALMAWLVGASLGMSGAALQGLLRNPLADAGVIGVSGFAALGAVAAFTFGWAVAWPLAAPICALVLALLAAVFVTAISYRAQSPATLALVGVGLSSLAGGAIALALNLAPNPSALADLVNWTLGSVDGRSLSDAGLILPFLAFGAALVLFAGRGLQALTVGEEAAAAMGANLNRTRILVVFGSACLAGAATAMVGVIGFVGVAAPHFVRRACEHDPARILLPSALCGGAILLAADLLVRVLPTTTELRLGVAAALIGGPLFALIAAQLAGRGGAR